VVVTTIAKEETARLPELLALTQSVKGADAVNRPGHPADLSWIQASLGFTLAGTKGQKRDELPCNGPSCLCKIFFFFFFFHRAGVSDMVRQFSAQKVKG